MVPAVSMPASAEAIAAWNHLKTVSNIWMHQPDFEALRICLATAKALDLETRPVWLMLIGPSGTGKTAYYIRCCLAYPKVEITDQTTLAGITSASKDSWGKGILNRLGTRGLWVFPDFTVILNMRDDRRNELFGIQRRIADGNFYRSADGKFIPWKGRVHSVAAVTPAIERYYHAHADLGQRYLQIRIEKAEPCDDLVRKTVRQNEHWEEFQAEILDASRSFINQTAGEPPEIPFPVSRKILDWADFVSLCRQPVSRNYRDEITGVAGEEGTSRTEQQLQGIVRADAWLMGQDTVGAEQMALVERIALDCLPRDRRAVLLYFRTKEFLDASDVHRMSGIRHPYAFDRVIGELKAIGALIQQGEGTLGRCQLRLSDRVVPLLAY